MTATAVHPPMTPTVEEFVQRHQSGLWRWLRALGCEAAAADEHCQDALLAGLHHGIDALPSDQAARWLRTAALNFHRKRLRTERRRPMTVDLELLEVHWRGVHGDRDGGDGALAALEGCVRALPARERELVALRYEQGLPRPAIGARLGIGDAGVKQALRRLRERLRRCVESKLERKVK